MQIFVDYKTTHRVVGVVRRADRERRQDQLRHVLDY